MSKNTFKELKAYRHILVTGPQRSGTTITAAMLAYSHGKVFLPDEAIGQNDVGRLKSMIGKSDFVLQCPALLPLIHTFDFEDTAVVIMVRPILEIMASINRIKWDGGQEEIERYKSGGAFDETIWLEMISVLDTPTRAITHYKYEMWSMRQRDKMKLPFFELKYKSLTWHPLWIAKEERKNFDPRQITHEHTNATQEKI